MKTYTQYIGHQFACAITNADTSGFSAEDLEQLEAFEKENPGHITIDIDAGFSFQVCAVSGKWADCFTAIIEVS